MSSSTFVPLTNSSLNSLLEDIKNNNYTQTKFKDCVTKSKITIIANSIIGYSKKTNIIFCLECCINLSKTSYAKHLKQVHSSILKEYKHTNTYNEIELTIQELTTLNINTLRDELSYNKYFFSKIPLILEGFKCRDCVYISVDRKKIRLHYNTIHINKNKGSKAKANYIIEQVPLQCIDRFRANKKLYFIPLLPKV